MAPTSTFPPSSSTRVQVAATSGTATQGIAYEDGVPAGRPVAAMALTIGISAVRPAEVGAWREIASRNCSGRLASASRPGTMPTVETVMCRAPMPMPRGSFRIVRAGETARQFINGSPIPMKTTFVTRIGGSRSAISRTWPKPKMLILSFPHNPTTTVVDRSFFERIVEFAHEHDLMVLHDFAYGDLVFDGREPRSFLAEPGARAVGVELFSMSKSYGMAGWRLGFVLGNAEVVASVELLQEHVRAGIFRAIQEAGIAALTGPQDTVEERRALYERRRDRVLAALGAPVPEVRCDGSFYVWLRLPPGATADGILAERHVALAPGEGFGPSGDGWARVSLATADDVLDAGLERLADAFGP